MAKYIFPAVFTPENGGYFVEFPDLEGCYTQGEDLRDAYEMAEDALNLKLWGCEEDKQEIPKASEIQEIKAEGGAFVTLIAADTVAYQKSVSNAAVKKTLTIPQWLDELAKKQSVNFSQILQEALMQKLGVQ